MLSVLSVGLMGPFIGMSDPEKAQHVIYRTFVLIHLYYCLITIAAKHILVLPNNSRCT